MSLARQTSDEIRRQWWFVAPVTAAAIISTLVLSRALGLADPLVPLSLPRIVFFLISFGAFSRFYGWGAWATLLWFAPAVVGEKRASI
jgi:hypothetical protein